MQPFIFTGTYFTFAGSFSNIIITCNRAKMIMSVNTHS